MSRRRTSTSDTMAYTVTHPIPASQIMASTVILSGLAAGAISARPGWGWTVSLPGAVSLVTGRTGVTGSG